MMIQQIIFSVNNTVSISNDDMKNKLFMVLGSTVHTGVPCTENIWDHCCIGITGQ
jgi:hypothetical protein